MRVCGGRGSNLSWILCDLCTWSLARPHRRGLHHGNGRQLEAIEGERRGVGRGGVCVCVFIVPVTSSSVDFLCCDANYDARVNHIRTPRRRWYFTVFRSLNTHAPQWQYDQTTATYLLLLLKKQRGKPVRLRPKPTACEDSCSPLHRGLQVTIPKMLCTFSGVLYTEGTHGFPAPSVLRFLFSLSPPDEGSPSLQRGRGRRDCGFSGLRIGVHR